MPDLEKTIQIVFAGQDKISEVTKIISRGMDDFGGKVQSATQPLADFADKLLKIEAALLALGAGTLALAIKQAGEFGDQFAEISTLIDMPRASLDGFRQDIINYGRDSTQSFDSINDSIYNAISAGVDYEKALATLSNSEKLAVATKGDLKDSTLLLTQTINAYGGDVSRANEFAAIYFQTIKSGVTRIDELSASVGAVTPIASQLGVDLETVAAALIALTKSGLGTSEAVTTLQSLFGSFLKPTDAVNKILGDNAEMFSASAIKSKGFEVALKDVLAAVNYDEEAIARLTGRKEALIAAMILGIDKAGFFKTALSEMGGAAENFEQAYAKMVDNFKNYNQALINNLQATLIEIGEPLLNEYGELATALSEIFKGISFGISEGAFDELFSFFEKFMSDLARDLDQIAQVVPGALQKIDYTEFLQSLKDLAHSVVGVFEEFFDIEYPDLFTEEGLAKVFQKLIDTGESLTKVVAGIIDSFKPAIGILGDFIDKINDSDEGVKEAVGNLLGYAKQINVIAGGVQDLSGAIKLLSGVLSVQFIGNFAKWAISLGQVGAASGAALGSLQAFGAYAISFGIGWGIGKALDAWVPGFSELADEVVGATHSIFSHTAQTEDARNAAAKYTEQLGKEAVEAVRLAESMGLLPSQKTTEVLVKGTPEYQAEFDKMLAYVQSVPDEKAVGLTTTFNPAQIQNTASQFLYEVGQQISPDGTSEQILEIKLNPDYQSIEKAKDAIDNNVPSEKIMEIKLQGEIDRDIAKIQAQADVLNNMFKYKAEVDIAEIEAGVERLRVLAETTNSMFQNTGDVIMSVLDLMGGQTTTSEWLELRRLLEAESNRRDQLVAAQVELTQAEAEWTRKKTESLDRGDALITIKADGVYPELDLVLHEIVRRAQIQANAEGLEFLGLG